MEQNNKTPTAIVPRVRGRARELIDGGWTYEIEVLNLGDPKPIWNGIADVKLESKEEAIKALNIESQKILTLVVETLEEKGIDYLDKNNFINLKTNEKFQW